MIRVGVLAQGLTMRVGLREVLRGLPDVDVVADSSTAEALPALDVLVAASADLLEGLGPEAPPVLLLTDDPEEAASLGSFSIWGVLPLEAGPEAISAAVHALAEGLWVGAPALARGLLGARPLRLENAQALVDPLTEREKQVLQLAAEGLANKQIATALTISENTVKFHLSSLYAKLGVTSRTEAVRAGARRGLVVL